MDLPLDLRLDLRRRKWCVLSFEDDIMKRVTSLLMFLILVPFALLVPGAAGGAPCLPDSTLAAIRSARTSATSGAPRSPGWTRLNVT